ncbi:MAG: hypothetical protein P8Z40_13340 [Chloroflexota bacterium]
MNSTTLRTLIAVVLFVHGIGHLQGVIAALGLQATEHWHARSWLFTDLLGESVGRILALVVWLASSIAALAAGLGLLGWLVPHPWWRAAAILSAITSSFGLVFYWHSLAMVFNKVGAIAVNLAILVSLVLLSWPPEAALGF